MDRDDRSGRAVSAQHAGRTGLPGTLGGGRQPVEHGGAQQRVPEGERRGVGQQPRGHEPLQRAGGSVQVEPGHRGRRRQRAASPTTATARASSRGRRRQALEPQVDGAGDRPRSQLTNRAGVDPSSRPARRASSPVSSTRSSGLPPVDSWQACTSGCVDAPPNAPATSASVARSLRAGGSSGSAGSWAEPLDGLARARLARPTGDGEQGLKPLEPARHVQQEASRLRVGPMNIVDRQHERSSACQAGEQPEQSMQRSPLLAGRSRARRLQHRQREAGGARQQLGALVCSRRFERRLQEHPDEPPRQLGLKLAPAAASVRTSPRAPARRGRSAAGSCPFQRRRPARAAGLRRRAPRPGRPRSAQARRRVRAAGGARTSTAIQPL